MAPARINSRSIDPPKKIQILVFCIANAMAKLHPTITIKPDNRSKPGTSSKATFFRTSASVTTIDAIGRK